MERFVKDLLGNEQLLCLKNPLDGTGALQIFPSPIFLGTKSYYLG